MIGLNLSHAAAGLPAATVAAWGSAAARFPLHAERDARPAIEALLEHGVRPLPVFVREAFEVRGRVVKSMESYRDELGDICDWWQVCNEPDGTHAGEGASWVMSQAELNIWLSEARALFPRPRYTLFGPGLVSGNPDWLRGVRLDLVEYVCPHPYNKWPHSADLDNMLSGYRRYGKPLWITESDSRVQGLADYLADYPGVAGVAVFCGHSYLDFGLVDHPRQLADYLALTGGNVQKPWNPPAWIGDGLRLAIQRDGATPLSGEHGSPPCVFTDRGIYFWNQWQERVYTTPYSTAATAALLAPMPETIPDPHAREAREMRQASILGAQPVTRNVAVVTSDVTALSCSMGERIPEPGVG